MSRGFASSHLMPAEPKVCFNLIVMGFPDGSVLRNSRVARHDLKGTHKLDCNIRGIRLGKWRHTIHKFLTKTWLQRL